MHIVWQKRYVSALHYQRFTCINGQILSAEPLQASTFIKKDFIECRSTTARGGKLQNRVSFFLQCCSQGYNWPTTFLSYTDKWLRMGRTHVEAASSATVKSRASSHDTVSCIRMHKWSRLYQRLCLFLTTNTVRYAATKTNVLSQNTGSNLLYLTSPLHSNRFNKSYNPHKF